ncbi:dynamin-related protein 4C-like protein, partial [Tanacetum coccineum]
MAEAFTSLISSIKNFPDFNITVPSFVFIGDESSGKSMLLESIAGLHIRSDAIQHIRSNVPLLFRIQDHLDPVQPQISLSYQDKFVDVGHVDKIPNRLYRATKEITENNEIMLVLKKKGAPDLFIVDLPEICREPTREKE